MAISKKSAILILTMSAAILSALKLEVFGNERSRNSSAEQEEVPASDAKSLYASGQFLKSARAYTEKIKTKEGAKNPGNYFYLGNCYYRLRYPIRAKALYKMVLEKFPDSEECEYAKHMLNRIENQSVTQVEKSLTSSKLVKLEPKIPQFETSENGLGSVPHKNNISANSGSAISHKDSVASNKDNAAAKESSTAVKESSTAAKESSTAAKESSTAAKESSTASTTTTREPERENSPERKTDLTSPHKSALYDIPCTFKRQGEFVKARINGKNLEVLVDAATARTKLSRQAAEELGIVIPIGACGGKTFANGKKIEYKEVTVNIALGPICKPKFNVWICDEEIVSNIGQDILREKRFTIDRKLKLLRFFH